MLDAGVGRKPKILAQRAINSHTLGVQVEQFINTQLNQTNQASRYYSKLKDSELNCDS